MTTEPILPVADTRRSDARRRGILEAAQRIFLERGYAATSMSEIAASVGGSKGTLYNYFRSKEELFEALMQEICLRAAAVFDSLPPPGSQAGLRASLIELGVSFMNLLLLDEIVAVNRVVIAECGRFPELGRMFYEAGPRRGEIRFSEYFEQAMAAGLVRSDDPKVVGQRLKDLVMSDLYLRRLWGLIDAIGPRELRDHVGRSVDIFLRAYAA